MFTFGGALCRRAVPLESLPSDVCLIAPNDCRLGIETFDIRRWLSASVVSEADFLIMSSYLKGRWIRNE
jgi:hypothetical protein